MPEGVSTEDGRPLHLDPAEGERAFAAAMAAPPGGGEDKTAPPKRDAKPQRDAPRGRPRVAKGGAKAAPPRQALPPAPSHSEVVTGVKGIIQIPAAVCLMLSQRAADPVPLKADAITLASSADELAEAVAATCDADERFARIVAKVITAGPYAALAGAVISVGTQVARNHGAPMPGTTDPAELVRMAGNPGEPVPAAA
jgi:hypothetical protein